MTNILIKGNAFSFAWIDSAGYLRGQTYSPVISCEQIISGKLEGTKDYAGIVIQTDQLLKALNDVIKYYAHKIVVCEVPESPGDYKYAVIGSESLDTHILKALAHSQNVSAALFKLDLNVNGYNQANCANYTHMRPSALGAYKSLHGHTCEIVVGIRGVNNNINSSTRQLTHEEAALAKEVTELVKSEMNNAVFLENDIADTGAFLFMKKHVLLKDPEIANITSYFGNLLTTKFGKRLDKYFLRLSAGFEKFGIKHF